MAHILHFPVRQTTSAAPSGSGASDERARRIAKAQSLILRAANLVEELGDKERRLSWILDDCADLLSRQLQSEAPPPHEQAHGTVE